MSSLSDSISVVVALVGLIGGGVYLYEQHEEEKAPPLEQQRMCSEQAAKVAKEIGPLTEINPYRFTSHFNQSLGRCFIETKELYVENGVSESLSIMDAFERTSYGAFIKRDVDGMPSICWFSEPGEKSKNCKSRDEWQPTARNLMGSAAFPD